MKPLKGVMIMRAFLKMMLDDWSFVVSVSFIILFTIFMFLIR